MNWHTLNWKTTLAALVYAGCHIAGLFVPGLAQACMVLDGLLVPAGFLAAADAGRLQNVVNAVDQLLEAKNVVIKKLPSGAVAPIPAFVLFVLLCAAPAFALDLIWTRNTEPDMKQYHVYLCKSKGCTATDLGALWVAAVPQPTAGVVPKFTLPANVEGAVALTAENQSGLFSGVSVSLPFSTMPVPVKPAVPSGLKLQ